MSRELLLDGVHFSVACLLLFLSFFFNDPATTEIYTLSLHDALPILGEPYPARLPGLGEVHAARQLARLRAGREARLPGDRKSTRLNSSHMSISYAVFCLKKKKKKNKQKPRLLRK